MTDANEWDFEEIEESEIESVPRGRKSEVDPKLVEGLRNLKAGKAFRLPSKQLNVKDGKYKTQKAALSAQLRAACRAAGWEPSITFSPDGVPQVKRKA